MKILTVMRGPSATSSSQYNERLATIPRWRPSHHIYVSWVSFASWSCQPSSIMGGAIDIEGMVCYDIGRGYDASTHDFPLGAASKRPSHARKLLELLPTAERAPKIRYVVDVVQI